MDSFENQLLHALIIGVLNLQLVILFLIYLNRQTKSLVLLFIVRGYPYFEYQGAIIK